MSMKEIGKSVAVAALLAASATSAQAADWSGAYGGAYLGGAYDASEAAVGVQLGYVFHTGNFVYGGELDAMYTSSGDTEVFAKARLGFALAERALVHVTGGYGTYNGNTSLYEVGFGGEYKLNGPVSLRADVEWHNTTGSNVFTGPYFVKVGGIWSF
ncbi:hypothetical protein [Aliiroseovarius subalbicans]|uniref:outer membrane protein n=1 Tax=Aliiroseovarius subalbicans TaxID=2925840 RepID=UPI001F58DD7D|nr:hypothetical protein [Aliiroseovarius subalbicans]MCI2398788.1 hypothetical protein [Aliiroseovarius subalbicans]